MPSMYRDGIYRMPAEWEPQKDEHLLARKLYEEFGKACYKYLDAKI